MQKLLYTSIGVLFGILLFKSEAVSWYKIHEMFLFKSFHMYGVIGSAVAVGATSLWYLKKYQIKTLEGEAICVAPKKFSFGTIFGGIVFGLGWGLIGACPGPIYVMIGAGYPYMLLVLLSALLGTWTYAALREKLPL